MDLTSLLRYAHQHRSKVQKETYELSAEQFARLKENLDRLKAIPVQTDCEKITERTAPKFLVDEIMYNIQEVLAMPSQGNDYPVLCVLNFNWKRSIGSFAIGLMNMIVSYRHKQEPPQKYTFSKCVVSIENIFLDNVLPEKNLFLLKKYIISKEIIHTEFPLFLDKLDHLFMQDQWDENTIKDTLSFLDKKKSDDKIYMNLEIYVKQEEEDNRFFFIKLDIAHKTELFHYSFKTLEEKNMGLVESFIKKITQTTKNPVQKLRSYANKKHLPLFEKNYHVPEQYLLMFFQALLETKWQDVGMLIYNLKKELDALDPYSGIFSVQLAICLEKETFHMGLYIPFLNISVEIYIEVLSSFYEKKKREFFPEEKYKTMIRKHALNPSLAVKQQDLFLMPYIQSARNNIISENVVNPTNVSTLPTHLKDEILRWRQTYKKNLRQYVSRFPEVTEKLHLHPSYNAEIQQLVAQQKERKQRQKEIQKYVFQHPSQQVGQQNRFRQDILRERKRIQQQLQKYQTPDEFIDDILTELNLMDTIGRDPKPIQRPVRSPYNPSAIYEQQSLKQWLSRRTLDPMSRKQMPTTFRPVIDQELRVFIESLHKKINQIMNRKQETDERKKLRLWKLKQELQKDNVFEQIIKKK